MPDIDYYLGLKYAQLQQHADAGSLQAQSAAQQAAAQARLVNTEADANQARLPFVGAVTNAALKQTQAQTGLIGANTNEVNQLLPGKVALGANQARLVGAEADFAPGRLQTQIQGQQIANTTAAAGVYPALYNADPDNPGLSANGGPLGVNTFTNPTLGAFLPSLTRRRPTAPNPLLAPDTGSGVRVTSGNGF